MKSACERWARRRYSSAFWASSASSLRKVSTSASSASVDEAPSTCAAASSRIGTGSWLGLIACSWASTHRLLGPLAKVYDVAHTKCIVSRVKFQGELARRARWTLVLHCTLLV